MSNQKKKRMQHIEELKKRMQQIEEQNRKAILKALKKGNLTFGEILEKRIVSRATLTSHLKKLLRDNSVEKVYDSERNRVVYHIEDKGKGKVNVESWITSLGIMATHYIVRKKLDKPIEPEHDIFHEIEIYLEMDCKQTVWSEMFKYLEEKYGSDFWLSETEMNQEFEKVTGEVEP